MSKKNLSETYDFLIARDITIASHPVYKNRFTFLDRPGSVTRYTKEEVLKYIEQLPAPYENPKDELEALEILMGIYVYESAMNGDGTVKNWEERTIEYVYGDFIPIECNIVGYPTKNKGEIK
jgi:hypothetical protein